MVGVSVMVAVGNLVNGTGNVGVTFAGVLDAARVTITVGVRTLSLAELLIHKTINPNR